MGGHVVVAGGGIAGLAAAFALRRDCPQAIRITVIDGAGRLGGKLHTSLFDGRPVDEGAEMFLARVPEAIDLATGVGLGGDLVWPVTTTASVVVDGRPHAFPAGTVLGIPADLEALAASALLSPDALRRVRAEAGEPGEALRGDVAVGDLVRRRLGAEVVDRLVDPLLGGVYAGRADALSLCATMPALAAALRTARSLVRAAQDVAASSRGADGPVFGSLRGGLGTLVDAVAARLDAEVVLGTPVRELHLARRGFRLLVGAVPHPTSIEADAVVLALPAAPASRVLRAAAPVAADELAGVEYASMAIVTLAYPTCALPAGSGLLVAATERRTVKAVTFSSQKWAHLSAGNTIVRASIGRHGEEEVLQRPDEDLAALAAADIAELTGIASAPIATRVTRWGGALPQYAVGHLDRVARITADVAGIPGLAVAGAAYGGVGVPACIRSGYAAAARIIRHLRESAHG